MDLLAKSDPLLESISGEVEKVNSSIMHQADAITSDYSDNKMIILNVLRSIDLSKSKLPAEFLQYKAKEEDKNNPFRPGDFEVKLSQIISRIENDNSTYDFDISSVDKYLFLIAKILSSAVASGCTETAKAARTCFATGFLRVRKNLLIPQDEELKIQFTEKCTEYMSVCYTYVSVMNMIDITNINLIRNKSSIETEVNKIEKSKDMLADLIKSSPALIKDIREASKTTFLSAGSTWKREIVDLYETIVQMRIAESNLKFKGLRLDIEEKRLYFYREVAEKLKAYVTSVPVPEDAGLIDKVKDLFSGTLQEADRVQTDFMKLNEMMDKFTESVRDISSSSKKSEFISGSFDRKMPYDTNDTLKKRPT